VTFLMQDNSIVNYLIQDGKSNYLEGGLLMAVYLV
jgi:Ca2+/H+ antiporter